MKFWIGYFLIMGLAMFGIFYFTNAQVEEPPFLKDLDREPIIHLDQNIIGGVMMLLDFEGSPLIEQLVNESDCWIGDTDDYGCGQSFTLDATYWIGGISIDFNTIAGTPTGDIDLRIETQNVDKPSGTLADDNAIKSFDAVGDAWNDIEFDTNFELEAGTYWITLTNSESQSGGDHWAIGRTSASEYAGGQAAYNTNGGVWTLNTYDLTFKVWEGSQPISSSTTATSTIFFSETDIYNLFFTILIIGSIMGILFVVFYKMVGNYKIRKTL